MTNAPFINTCVLTVLVGAASLHAQTQRIDETWTVTVGGQTVFPNPDGSFRVPNIIAIDTVGDGISDDFLRVIAIGIGPGGQAKYASSDPFRLSRGETFRTEALTFSDNPFDLVRSLRIQAPDELDVGNTATLVTTATLSDDREVDVSSVFDGTNYRSSNPAILRISADAEIIGVGDGVALIIASNGGAATTKRIRVGQTVLSTTIRGFVQFEDGTPVVGGEAKTLEGEITFTAPDGAFQIPVIRESPSSLRVVGNLVLDNVEHRGASQLLPLVRNGVTDVGIVVLKPVNTAERLFHHPRWETKRELFLADMTMADFNGDGAQDVAGVEGAEVFVNTFDPGGIPRESQRFFPNTGPLRAIRAGDLNGDGSPDLVTVSRFGGGDNNFYTQFINDGEGFFPIGIFTDGGSPSESNSIILADLDNDGLDDVVTKERLGDPVRIAVGRNNGAGQFTDFIRYELVGSQASDVRVADMNGDGFPDVLLMCTVAGTSNLYIGTNDGRGDFCFNDSIVLPEVPAGAGGFRFFEIADFNLDTLPDIAASTWPGAGPVNGDLLIFTNTGGGTFILQQTGPALNFVLDVKDVDGDRDQDLVGIGAGGRVLTTLLNDGTGLLGSGFFADRFSGDLVGIGDVTLDGSPDYFVSSRSSGSSSFGFYENDGAGGFLGGSVMSISGQPNAVDRGDLTGDGVDDVVVALPGLNALAVFPNQGNGSLGSQILSDLGASDRIPRMEILDIDGDDSDEVLALIERSGNSRVAILESDGMGALTVAVSLTVTSPQDMTILDRTGDGRLDIAVAEDTDIRVFDQDPGGNFNPLVLVDLAVNVVAIRSADVNGDGSPDIVALLGQFFSDWSLITLQSDGLGGFFEADRIMVPPSSNNIQVADLNGDLQPDVILGGPVLVVYHGTPTGFVESETHRGGSSAFAQSLEIVDLDLDQQLDIVASGIGPSLSAMFYNSGAGTFSMRRHGTPGFFADGMDTMVGVDLDLDGDQDVVAVSSTGHIAVLQNLIRD